MDGLMLHCGGESATYKQIGAVPLPEQTDTYMPVSHKALIDKVVEVTQDVLHIKLDKAGYGLGSNGDHLFAHLRFNNPNATKEMGLCIGVVNSYDKRLRVRLAAGANVFVCDNLAITGDITYTRKHTTGVWPDIDDAIANSIGGAEAAFQQILEDAERMKMTEITDDVAFQVMGLMYGRGILKNQMLTIAHKQWINPEHKQFMPRTQWSLYNAINSALKKARPGDIMESHRALHRLLGGPSVRFDQSVILPN